MRTGTYTWREYTNAVPFKDNHDAAGIYDTDWASSLTAVNTVRPRSTDHYRMNYLEAA